MATNGYCKWGSSMIAVNIYFIVEDGEYLMVT